MNDVAATTLLGIYYGVTAVFAAALTWQGWRQGAARQAITFASVLCAYGVGFLGFWYLEPAFRFLGYPQPITRAIAAAASGVVTFIALKSLCRLCKRTADLPAGGVRVRSGIAGALLGAVFGVLLFFVSALAIRVIGAFAQSNVDAFTTVTPNALPQPEPGGLVRGIAKLREGLTHGGSGQLFDKVDPVSPKAYATIVKLGLMVSRPEAIDRFLSYPGVASVAHHPKLHELRIDPSVAELLEKGSFFKLLRNERVVALASDPEFAKEIRTVEFEQALDFALTGKKKDKPPGM